MLNVIWKSCFRNSLDSAEQYVNGGGTYALCVLVAISNIKGRSLCRDTKGSNIKTSHDPAFHTKYSLLYSLFNFKANKALFRSNVKRRLAFPKLLIE